MRHFDVDVKVNQSDVDWMVDIGNNITEPNWTIRPYKLSDAEIDRLDNVLDQIPIRPEYAAIIMVPANTMCKTHVDNKANATGIRQRITAINIPLQIDDSSTFQYMDGDTIEETIHLLSPKCWRVDIPHRVDNRLSPTNRVVLSLSFVETVEDMYEAFLSHLPNSHTT